MGWGKMAVITDSTEEDIESWLTPFIGHSAQYEVVKSEATDGYRRYELMTDCGIVVYCSMCGAICCPGCGSRPNLAVLASGSMASCSKPACRMDFDGMLYGTKLPSAPVASHAHIM